MTVVELVPVPVPVVPVPVVVDVVLVPPLPQPDAPKVRTAARRAKQRGRKPAAAQTEQRKHSTGKRRKSDAAARGALHRADVW